MSEKESQGDKGYCLNLSILGVARVRENRHLQWTGCHINGQLLFFPSESRGYEQE